MHCARRNARTVGRRFVTNEVFYLLMKELSNKIAKIAPRIKLRLLFYRNFILSETVIFAILLHSFSIVIGIM